MDTSNQIQEKPAVAEKIPSFGAKPEQKKTKAIPKFVFFVLGAVFVVFILFLLFRLLGNRNNRTPSEKTPVVNASLTWWGLWEPSEVLDSQIKAFQNQNPGVTITYTQQSIKDYRERLQGAFARGQGPDIFRFHNTWVPMLMIQEVLASAPTNSGIAQTFERTFYPFAVKDLRVSGNLVGVPLMTDGLALYVNKKALAVSGKSAPKTWQELSILAKDLTIRGEDGKIERAGIALGSANNVDHFSDILALLILQNGGNPGIPEDRNNLVSDALTFYTQFLRTDRTWDETLPNSTYAFATEKVAMIFAPSWRAFEIKQINPNIDFAVYPVPQLPGKPVTFASYWVEGVSKMSKNQQVAWKFLEFLSSKEVLQKLYSQASTQRLFGEVYPRMDMADLLAKDPYVGAYVEQANSGVSWYLSSRTFDNGINDQIIKYYQDAVNGIVGGKNNSDVMPTLSTGVSSVLNAYKIKLQ